MTTRIQYCGQCGAGNPLENKFCHDCGSKLSTNPIDINVPEAFIEPKVILEPQYAQLEEKLNQLIELSGYLVVSNKERFVQFLKEEKSYKIYFDLGDVSNFDKNQLKKINEMGFLEVNGAINKPIVLTYKEKAIREIVLDAKKIFDDIYKLSPSNFFEYDENYGNKEVVNKIPVVIVDEPKKKISGKTIFFGLVIILALIGYCNRSDQNSNTSNQVAEIGPEENIDLNKFSGQQFTFKSKLNDNEVDGKTVQTNHETTYHTFDFVNKTITQKSPLNGEWVTVTYPINGFYEEKGLAATTYVIKVGTLGCKEIWFSPDVPNLGYDYEDGTRIACYEITKE